MWIELFISPKLKANVEKADHLLQSIQKEIAALAAQCQAMSESTEKATTAQEERMVPGMGRMGRMGRLAEKKDRDWGFL